MSNLSTAISFANPIPVPKNNDDQVDNSVIDSDLDNDASDTDDAPNEELESLQKTDDNNLKKHPNDVDNES